MIRAGLPRPWAALAPTGGARGSWRPEPRQTPLFISRKQAGPGTRWSLRAPDLPPAALGAGAEAAGGADPGPRGAHSAGQGGTS